MPNRKSTGSKANYDKVKEYTMSELVIRPATPADKLAPRTRMSKGSKYDVLTEALAKGPMVVSTDKTISGLRSGLTAWASKRGVKLSIRTLEAPDSLLVSFAKED